MNKQSGSIVSGSLWWLATVFLFVIVFLLVVVGLLWQKCHEPDFMPIKEVKIHGIYRQVSPHTLKQALLPLVVTNIFTVDLQAINKQLLLIPWIAAASVKRVWPDTLAITLTEYQAVARWNETGLVSAGGKVFYPQPSTFPKNLITLRGPDGQSHLMLDGYQAMKTIVEPLLLPISEVDLTQRRSWSLVLDNKITLFIGRDNILPRLKHFIFIYRQLTKEQQTQLGYVDLRYSNGVAIHWRNENDNNVTN